MRTIDQRKGQLRDLGRVRSPHVKLVALLLEMRIGPIDEFEKKFSEAYLMKLAGLQEPDEKEDIQEIKEDEEVDPFA
jgi:hypothetical protein